MEFSKKFCFVIPGWVTKHTGGAELQSNFIAEELIERGWQVEVVTIKPDNLELIKENRYYNPKIKYHYYKNHKLALMTWFAVFLKLLKTDSSVYYQRTISIISGATALFSKLFRKKMIFAIAHDDDVKKDKIHEGYTKYHISNRNEARSYQISTFNLKY